MAYSNIASSARQAAGERYSTMIQTGSDITSWYDMKGQTVSIRLGTGAEQVVRRYFETVDDFSWEDFNWVDLKVEDMSAALADGSIASFTAWEPTPAIAEATIDAQVMMSYGEYALTPVLIHTTKAYAESHHDELVAFLKGQLVKVDMIQKDPDKAARIPAQAASEILSELVDLFTKGLSVQSELVKILEKEQKTVVFVTHSVIEAVFLADLVVIMTARPGKVKGIVKIDLPRKRSYVEDHYLHYREQILDLLEEEVEKGFED